MKAHPELVKHNQQFPKSVIELAPGVYTAVGYAASNVHMLVGDNGVVIIDTTESTSAATNILAEFRRITDKPVTTIIYSHSHRDHISGATVFAEGGTPEIIANHKFRSDLVNLDDVKPNPGQALIERAKLQFGIGLSFPDERVNLGCGPGDRPMQGLGQDFLPPTKIVHEESVTLTRAGVRFTLAHAPGETPDHLVLWLEDRNILFCGDNYYHAFPNLYPLRGSSYRDFDAWADTLDLLLSYNAEIMAPGHTLPVFGADAIRERLTDYRDAIRHIVSETADAMNAGLGWDEIVGRVTLPDHLTAKPHLKELYGKVQWSVRAYCVGTLGWFDGNPTNISRLSPREEARRFVDLAGGYDALLAKAERACADEDHQWALELCDRLLTLQPEDQQSIMIKINSMRALAEIEINPTARNTYLLAAKRLETAGE